jgi:hypothetical protein
MAALPESPSTLTLIGRGHSAIARLAIRDTWMVLDLG